MKAAAAATTPVAAEPVSASAAVDTCVYASGAFFCDYVSLTDDYRCCAYQGDNCGWDAECCGFSRCSDQGVCIPLG
jgi:hypothetical protein